MSKRSSSVLLSIWRGESWWFFIHIGVALALIRFIIYPLLGLFLATGFPIVAVVSGSMEHAYVPQPQLPVGQGLLAYQYCDRAEVREKPSFAQKEFTRFSVFWKNCGAWYEERNISASRFRTFPFRHGFNTGDIMILYGTKPERVRIGDIIVFRSKIRTDPIIHRVVNVTQDETGFYFTTKGDHNADTFLAIGEDRIHESQYLGRAVLSVPYLGWVKIIFTKLFYVLF